MSAVAPTALQSVSMFDRPKPIWQPTWAWLLAGAGDVAEGVAGPLARGAGRVVPQYNGGHAVRVVGRAVDVHRAAEVLGLGPAVAPTEKVGGGLTAFLHNAGREQSGGRRNALVA